MIARYDMRYATPEERIIFPTHRLVINVVKAKIIKITNSPYFNPEMGIGSIVWAVESYPGSYQFRMLYGDLLHEQRHKIEWERVPDETPITTCLCQTRRGATAVEARDSERHSAELAVVKPHV